MERASFYKAHAEFKAKLCRSIGMSALVSPLREVPPAPPHKPRHHQLTALIIEAEEQNTVYLYHNKGAAEAAEAKFERDNAALIDNRSVRCDVTFADIASLTPTADDQTGGRIVFAFIGEFQQSYSVSLHDDEASKLAALARFRLDSAEFVEERKTWVACHAVPLALNWRFP